MGRGVPQDFYSRRHVTLCRADDADGRRWSCAREWAVEQAFASYVTVGACLFRSWRRHRDIRVNASATRALPFAQLDAVDRDWRRQLTGPPFRARQSSRNRPVRLR